VAAGTEESAAGGEEKGVAGRREVLGNQRLCRLSVRLRQRGRGVTRGAESGNPASEGGEKKEKSDPDSEGA